VRRNQGHEPSWLRLHGRANARLHILARAMDAQFVEPPSPSAFAKVRGRVLGCVFELRVAHRRLEFELRHYSAHETHRLDGDGLVPPEIDPVRLRAAIEAAAAQLTGKA